MIPNYNDKKLQVAFSLSGKKKDRVFVFNPQTVHSEINTTAGDMYGDFLARGEYDSVEVKTRQGPGELAGTLEEKFGVYRSMWVGGMAAQIDATLLQAREIFNDLRDNPQNYYSSPEEKEFG